MNVTATLRRDSQTNAARESGVQIGAGDRFVVEGGRSVGGVITPAGNKNEALPVLAAALLAPGVSRIGNLPRIRDVATQLQILGELGADAVRDPETTETVVDASRLSGRDAPSELARTIRGSLAIQTERAKKKTRKITYCCYLEFAAGFDSTEFWPASLVNQMPSQALGGIFPSSTSRSS